MNTNQNPNSAWRFRCTLFLCLLATLTGCATRHAKMKGSPKDSPETVLVTYHVRPGMEKDFEALLARAWTLYQDEHMVRSAPHVLVRDAEESSTVGYVEIFTWVSHSTPAKAPDSVKKIWAEEQAMCEARAGRSAIGGGEVQLLK
jgi:hypothetical protein